MAILGAAPALLNVGVAEFAVAPAAHGASVRQLDWRPPGKPRYGGHIERLIGTQMGGLHLLPGTTFRNVKELGDYDPKRHAALTLRELERYIALDILGKYHQSIHRSLARPPLAVWREHEGRVPLRLPQDRMRFWLTFLPEHERTLQPTGIHLFASHGHFLRWAESFTEDDIRGRRCNLAMLLQPLLPP